ncbi:MAG: EAL domain-containing protein [Myxococcota bacterium]
MVSLPLPDPEVILGALRGAERKLPALLEIVPAAPRWVDGGVAERTCAALGEFIISEQSTTGALGGLLLTAFPRRLAWGVVRRLRGQEGPARAWGGRTDHTIWREVTTTLGSQVTSALRASVAAPGTTAPAGELTEGRLELGHAEAPVLTLPVRLRHGGMVVDGFVFWALERTSAHPGPAPSAFDPAIFEATSHPSLVVGPSGDVSYVNRTFAVLGGSSPPRQGGSLVDALPDGAPTSLRGRIQEALDQGTGSFLGPALHPEAKRDLVWEIVPLAGGQGAVVHANSIAQAVREERELVDRDEEISRLRVELDRRDREVRVDAVTGLALREGFRERLVRVLMTEREPGAVILVDLDGFRNVNQTFGPEVGDDLLRTVATRARYQLRNLDFAARVGSDEIAMLVTGVKGADAGMEAAWELMRAVSAPLEVRGRELFLSAGVGVALFPEHGRRPEDLLAHAERALVQAKRAGRGEIRMFSPADRSMEDRLSLWSALRRAVAEQDFTLHFQPQVDLRTMRATGVEALLRWDHPESGPMSPAVFVPMLEESGLIGTVGAWVLDQACRTAASWGQEEVASMRVSVNVSARQLYSGDFVSSVRRVLEGTGLPPARLELEVTETLLMQDFSTSARTLAALKDLGTHVAVDDFGTGYSSLSYLKRLPVDTLKIDRAFIRELDRDAEDVAICRAIIELGHELGLTIVAEGAETRCQLERLDDLGCDVVQGFFLGRPMAEAALRSWAAKAASSSAFPAA